jgi:hypothetical protein
MKYLSLIIPILLTALEPTIDHAYDNAYDPLVIMSSNKEYRGSITYGTGNTEYIPIDEFVLKDKDGRIQYSTDEFGHTVVDIANNGVFVGIDFDGPVSGKGMLFFYDQKGRVTGTSDIGFLLDRKFSYNGEKYCVNDGFSGVRVFQSNGTELYSLGKANFFSISNSGAMVAAARDAQIDIYKGADMVHSIPLNSPFVRQMVFSQDDALIAFIDKKHLYCYDIEQKSMVFQYTETNDHLHFISCDISPDRTMIIAGLDEDHGRNGASRHQQGSIVLLNRNGKVMWSYQMTYASWNIHTPHVMFTGSSSFSVETVERIMEFSF